jgi:hypothetical protein
VLFYFAGQTGQVVKRAAVGADGYVLDHYNRAAIDLHLREAGDKLLSAVAPGSVDSVFCDSLEVYDADWTGDSPRGIQQAARLRPAAAAADRRVRHGRERRHDPPRLRTHAHRAVRERGS